jgi:hypothetical protein
MKSNQLSLQLAITGLIFAFQNCSGVSFSSIGPSKTIGVGTSTVTIQTNPSETVSPPAPAPSPSPSASPVVEIPPAQPPQIVVVNPPTPNPVPSVAPSPAPSPSPSSTPVVVIPPSEPPQIVVVNPPAPEPSPAPSPSPSSTPVVVIPPAQPPQGLCVIADDIDDDKKCAGEQHDCGLHKGDSHQQLKIVKKHSDRGDKKVCMSKPACEVLGAAVQSGSLKLSILDNTVHRVQSTRFQEAHDSDCEEHMSDDDVDKVVGHRDDDDNDDHKDHACKDDDSKSEKRS